MSEIQVFNNPQFGEIRTAGTAEEPLFCLADVCKALELTPSKVAQRLEKDVLSKYPLQTAGGIQELNFVNEVGLYDVILDSRKPEAKAFRKWVTSEVLPSIRKTGQYTVSSSESSQPAADRPCASVQEVEASIRWIEFQRTSLGLDKQAVKRLIKREGKRLGLPVAGRMSMESIPSTEGATSSATELLRYHDFEATAMEFNRLMVRYGLLVEKRTSGSNPRTYKALTREGLAFGKNRAIPNGNGATWPVYYRDMFPALCLAMKIQKRVPF